MSEYLSEQQLITFVKKIAPSLIKKIFSIGGEQYEKILVNTELVFSNYIKIHYEKYSKIKTILYRDKPVSLKQHYVQTSFTCDSENIETIKTFDYFSSSKKNIIIGTAGAGKSIFMKRFFIDLIDNDVGFIPILIELRILKKNNTYINIYDYIYNMLQELDNGFSKKQLNYSLKNGKIALLLDGFDEIDESHKNQFESEILKLSEQYKEIIVIITSRPDHIFDSWEQFHILKTNTLSKDESIQLIEKIQYDEELKQNFISDLDKTLYEKHKDFTSNPLLLTMMLLTYEQYAKIPEKMHIFYNEAFNTLFNKHDATKQQFKRKTHCELPVDDFKKLFSTFCILSFLDDDFSFDKDKILSYIEKAINFSEIKTDKNLFLDDLLDTVCVIVKDGNSYSFAHRSFQEYFSAFFISNNYHWENIYRIIDTIFYKIVSSNVIQLLFDLNSNMFEKTYLIKKIQKMNSELSKINIKDNPYVYLQFFITSLTLEVKNDGNLQYQPRIKLPFNSNNTELEQLYKRFFFIELISIDELYKISMLSKLGQLIRNNINTNELINILFKNVNFQEIKKFRHKFSIEFRTNDFKKNKNKLLNDYLIKNEKIITGLIEIQKELIHLENKLKASSRIKQTNIDSLFRK